MTTICRANWQDEKQYPDVKKASAQRWAWEFLRRNPDYESDWKRLVNAKRAVALRVPEITQYVECVIADTVESWAQLRATCADDAAFSNQMHRWHSLLCDEDEMIVFDPPRLAGESNFTYLNRVEKSLSRPLSFSLGEKWGLKLIVQPANAVYNVPRVMFLSQTAHGVSFPNLDFRAYKKHASRERWLEHCESQIERLGEKFPHHPADHVERLVLAFDLRYPIKAQMDAAREHLKWLQQHLKAEGVIQPFRAHKKEPRNWFNYLRALDAAADNVQVDGIVSALLPKEAARNTSEYEYAPRKKVEGWLKTGEELTQTGYRRIALISGKRPSRKE